MVARKHVSKEMNSLKFMLAFEVKVIRMSVLPVAQEVCLNIRRGVGFI
jgi:hypothetical protein